MKTRLLFPNQCKRIGWILLIPSTIFGILIIFFNQKFEFLDSKAFTVYSSGFGTAPTIFGFIKVNYAATIVGVIFIIGTILVAFSKEKDEDE
ncbi:MAG: hypothetical protein M0P66_13440, partial [Salinivirgaceae bacterium]|nr:hypothetical protein [Salinivirgaceae bacterium]